MAVKFSRNLRLATERSSAALVWLTGILDEALPRSAPRSIRRDLFFWHVSLCDLRGGLCVFAGNILGLVAAITTYYSPYSLRQFG